jgi:putative aminopeptidase FrvX
MSETVRLWVPRLFWDDHADRCCDHPGMRRELVRLASRIKVELDKDALDDLKSDAEYYAGNGAPDWHDGAAIRRSAKKCRAALAKVQP